MPAISVILPTYNRAYCLDRAVGSLLAQTFEDWELILVDDGSTDRTSELRREFASVLGARYRDLDSQRRGASGARNLGIEAARGEWIAFLDSDDVWIPEKLGLQLDALHASPEAGFCYTDFFEFDDAYHILHPRHIIPAAMEGSIYPQLLEIRHNLITCPSVMARRDLVIANGGFDESMRVCEDIDLWTRLSRLAPVVAVRMPLTGVHSRHDQRFPYVESVKGRDFLYRRAAERDGALTGGFLRMLYDEAFEAFQVVARIKGDVAEAASLEAARRRLADLKDDRFEAVTAIVDDLVDRLSAAGTSR
ncbi:MAG: glycosyltransferase [Rhizobiaceae bacterium]|nr:glycosyltransferase [Rhizobiaceae bacterium]